MSDKLEPANVWICCVMNDLKWATDYLFLLLIQAADLFHSCYVDKVEKLQFLEVL